MATISLCMIVKNEEAVLDRCLSSIADLMDEIIIVDTGSTDGTKEIAARYTDRLYDFKWNNDFSSARNFSFSKATMDYIYTADADEVLDYANHRRFTFLKQSLQPEVDIVQMKYITPDEFNTVMNIRDEYRPKLYKRLRQFRWIDPIHETVQIQPLVFDSDIEILHMPDKQHSSRDFALFLHAFKNGQEISDKLHTMYARELYISGSDQDFQKAEPIFMRTLIEHDEKTSRCQEAACILCRCMRIKNDISGFFKYALRAMTYYPCSEICCELAAYFKQINDFEESILWYSCAAHETTCVLDVHTSGDLPLLGLSECYARLSEAADLDLKAKDDCISASASYRAAAEAWEMPHE